MTREEAAEIILRGGAWDVCERCDGRGRITRNERENCTFCMTQGHLLNAQYKEAAELLQLEIPPRPLTPMEQMANLIGEHFKDRLTAPSPMRALFPTQMIPDESLAEHSSEKKLDES